MPHLTLTENLKLQLSPGLVASSYDIQLGNGVGLFWDKHKHVCLLTYLPRNPHGAISILTVRLTLRSEAREGYTVRYDGNAHGRP